MKRLKISVSFLFFAFAALWLSGEMQKNFTLAVVFSLLHEGGHIVALLVFGVGVKKITIGVFGIKISADGAVLSCKQECIAALCGPFVNLIFLSVFMLTDEISALINCGLLGINLLPLRFTDGGRFIFFLLSDKFGAVFAEKACNILEMLTGFVFAVIFILSLIFDFFNYSFAVFCLVFVIDKLCCIFNDKSV